MRDLLLSIIFISLIILLVKACNTGKDVVECTIDIVHNYSEYADSVFNK